MRMCLTFCDLTLLHLTSYDLASPWPFFLSLFYMQSEGRDLCNRMWLTFYSLIHSCIQSLVLDISTHFVSYLLTHSVYSLPPLVTRIFSFFSHAHPLHFHVCHPYKKPHSLTHSAFFYSLKLCFIPPSSYILACPFIYLYTLTPLPVLTHTHSLSHQPAINSSTHSLILQLKLLTHSSYPDSLHSSPHSYILIPLPLIYTFLPSHLFIYVLPPSVTIHPALFLYLLCSCALFRGLKN